MTENNIIDRPPLRSRHELVISFNSDYVLGKAFYRIIAIGWRAVALLTIILPDLGEAEVELREL